MGGLIAEKWIERGHIALIVLGVFVYTGCALPFGRGEDGSGNDPFYTLFSAILLLGSAPLTVWHWRTCAKLVPRIWPLCLLVALAFVSASWSQIPADSIRRAGSLMVLVVYAMSAYAAFGPMVFMRIVVRSMVVISIACVAVAIWRPAIGLDVGDYSSAIRGLYGQKNVFGIALLNTSLALSFVVLERHRIVLSDVLVAGLLLVMLVLSRSTTSLLLVMMTMGATTAWVLLERGGVLRALTVFLIAAGAIGAFFFAVIVGPAGLFELIGKDSTLTGRTEIWEAVWQSINRRWLLGYGYNAFWLPDSREVASIWEAVGWNTPAAHSGYLDTMLQFGYVGISVVGFLVLVSVWRAIRALLSAQRSRGFWLLLLLVMQAILDRTESGLLSPDERMVFWVIALLAAHVMPVAARFSPLLPVRPLRASPPDGEARPSAVRWRNS